MEENKISIITPYIMERNIQKNQFYRLLNKHIIIGKC